MPTITANCLRYVGTEGSRCMSAWARVARAVVPASMRIQTRRLVLLTSCHPFPHPEITAVGVMSIDELSCPRTGVRGPLSCDDWSYLAPRIVSAFGILV